MRVLLDPASHAVLRILSNHAQQGDVETFIRASKVYVNSGDFQRVDAILQVSASANRALFRRIREEDSEMCQALREIMKEDFEEAEARGEARGEAKGLKKGLKQGVEKGESRLGSLMTKLKEAGRTDDAFHAAEDPAFRQKLYKEFKLA